MGDRSLAEHGGGAGSLSCSGEINFRLEDTAAALARVEAAMQGQAAEDIDGVSYSFTDWRFNVRLSTPSRCCGSMSNPGDPALLSEKTAELQALIGQARHACCSFACLLSSFHGVPCAEFIDVAVVPVKSSACSTALKRRANLALARCRAFSGSMFSRRPQPRRTAITDLQLSASRSGGLRSASSPRPAPRPFAVDLGHFQRPADPRCLALDLVGGEQGREDVGNIL